VPRNDWPFEDWFRLAVLNMNMAPQDFWNLPARDWFWLCRKRDVAAIDETSFQALFEAFPDEKEPS
jgi:hypothetical protein